MSNKFDTNQWIRSWSDKKEMTPLPERSKQKESASDPNEQNWFTRAMMTSMIAENPTVAAANGYRIKSNGDVVQEDTPESRQLAKNLAVLGVAGAGALAFGTGAAAKGLKTVWNIANNPFVSAGVDVATGNYGDAAVGLATDFIPFNRVVDFFSSIKDIIKSNGNFYKIDRPLPFTTRDKIRGYIAGYVETDPQIQELYNRIPNNTELVRKWSDLADDNWLAGIDRRKFILNNVISAVNKTSRTIDVDTPKSNVFDYIYRVRGEKAYGDRQLRIPAKGNEILHFGDDALTTRTHLGGPQGILENKNIELSGDIKDVDLDINNPFYHIDNSWIIDNRSAGSKVFVPEELKDKLLNSIRRSSILPQIDLDLMVHTNKDIYKPGIRINMFENKYNTLLDSHEKTVLYDKTPQNASWWQVPGFYDLKHKK